MEAAKQLQGQILNLLQNELGKIPIPVESGPVA